MAELYFPFLPHDKTRESCSGYLIPDVAEDEVRLVCNECRATVRTLRREEFDAGLIPADLLPDVMTFARCPHCRATQVFHGFTIVASFVCTECGTSVEIPQPLQ